MDFKLVALLRGLPHHHRGLVGDTVRFLGHDGFIRSHIGLYDRVVAHHAMHAPIVDQIRQKILPDTWSRLGTLGLGLAEAGLEHGLGLCGAFKVISKGEEVLKIVRLEKAPVSRVLEHLQRG